MLNTPIKARVSETRGAPLDGGVATSQMVTRAGNSHRDPAVWKMTISESFLQREREKGIKAKL